MTTRALTGIWFAAGRGSRSTRRANASDPLVRTPTVSAFSPRLLPMAIATSTPRTTATLRSIAPRIDACTETRTVMSAASWREHGRLHVGHRDRQQPRQRGGEARLGTAPSSARARRRPRDPLREHAPAVSQPSGQPSAVRLRHGLVLGPHEPVRTDHSDDPSAAARLLDDERWGEGVFAGDGLRQHRARRVAEHDVLPGGLDVAKAAEQRAVGVGGVATAEAMRGGGDVEGDLAAIAHATSSPRPAPPWEPSRRARRGPMPDPRLHQSGPRRPQRRVGLGEVGQADRHRRRDHRACHRRCLRSAVAISSSAPRAMPSGVMPRPGAEDAEQRQPPERPVRPRTGRRR